MSHSMRVLWAACAGVLALIGLVNASPAALPTTPNPILFVTQYPIKEDFTTISSAFGNQISDVGRVGRGGDLYLRYPDGTLRNLTAEAGFGVLDGQLQSDHAIAVREPAMHWSGTKAVFSMVIGAPVEQYHESTVYWQLYEVSGAGLRTPGQPIAITKVPNQPTTYNNVMPTYASDGSIIFASDRMRDGLRHHYPQRDEYEEQATVSGLWKLNPATGALFLLEHSPSGSFTPIVASDGRIVFTRWDHLQQDQQNDGFEHGSPNPHGVFNYDGEGAGSAPTTNRSELFPESHDDATAAANGVHVVVFNQFFMWEILQDGTHEETLGHVGRHEFMRFFFKSFLGDNALTDFSTTHTTLQENGNFGTLHISEDPTAPGCFVATNAPEFASHGAGQIVRFCAPLGLNPEAMSVHYLTAPRDSVGHFRNPIVLSDGRVLAAYAATHTDAGRGGPGEADTTYKFRLTLLATQPDGSLLPAANGSLTAGSGIARDVKFWSPNDPIHYVGPMWELSPVEVRARPMPPTTGFTADEAPEHDAFALEGVDPNAFRSYLRQHDLGVVVMRNVTSRDRADRQQPFNLRVPGGVESVVVNGQGNPIGHVYDIARMQFVQADLIRGVGGSNDPDAGRRPLPQWLHDTQAMIGNNAAFGAPSPSDAPASVPIAAGDGSAAAFVPARRALAWQSLAPDGSPVVRERYWITLQPGEVRSCPSCHGVNTADQIGRPPATNTSLAFRQLLARWRDTAAFDVIFADGFQHP